MIDPQQLTAAYETARADLLAERNAAGFWEGQLSSSALATATAVSTLAIAQRATVGPAEESRRCSDTELITRGVEWLIAHQNQDGGWGDTDKSRSNIATTMLATAAIHLAGRRVQLAAELERANGYVQDHGAIGGLRARFGRDKTFAVPILTNCALAELVDWSEVAALPFELACLPQRLYRWARLPVVSYAIPALVAIGQARFVHRGPRFPITRLIRRAAIEPSLRVLQRMQPDSGGYLEAVPLTSFVTMSLAATGRTGHRVSQQGLGFIRASVRADGSWPIDTNLATWNTSLAINALAADGGDVSSCADPAWLLSCQHVVRHPFTGAEPGGWGWTNLSGAVPDADDTAGALLALHHWQRSAPHDDAVRRDIERSVPAGVGWLLNLQNRDGGWPTFCRGWGKLPFDRSGADLTAHAMRALHAWQDVAPRRIGRAIDRGWRYLRGSQRADGSWIPLWFGHQDHPSEENPVFGTARVLLAFGELGANDTEAAQRGYRWLASVQCGDGGWQGGRWSKDDSLPGGAASSVEETSLAVEALLGAEPDTGLQASLSKGLQWLTERVLADRHRENAPIGFYFAKLWYHERLYPLVFAVAALGRAVHRFGKTSAQY